jgi:hypothetical protein
MRWGALSLCAVSHYRTGTGKVGQHDHPEAPLVPLVDSGAPLPEAGTVPDDDVVVLGVAVVDVAVVLVAADGGGVVLLDGAALADGDGDTGGADVVVDALGALGGGRFTSRQRRNGSAAVFSQIISSPVVVTVVSPAKRRAQNSPGVASVGGPGNGAGGDTDGAGAGAGLGGAGAGDLLVLLTVVVVGAGSTATTEGPGIVDVDGAGAFGVLRGAVVLCVVVAAGTCTTGSAPDTLLTLCQSRPPPAATSPSTAKAQTASSSQFRDDREGSSRSSPSRSRPRLEAIGSGTVVGGGRRMRGIHAGTAGGGWNSAG